MARGNITLQKTIVAISNARQKQNFRRKTRSTAIEGNNSIGDGGNFNIKTATSRRAGKTRAEYIIFCHRLCLYLDINPLDYLQKLKHQLNIFFRY